MIIPAVAAISLVGMAVHGTFHRNSRFFGSVLSRLPTREARVALTFDDGPNECATPAILDMLEASGVKATFFMLGRHVVRWPRLVERAAAEGHQMGNHGYFHRKLHLKLPGYVKRDLLLGTQVIEEAGGGRVRFFRAPHGFRSPWVSRIASSLGQRTVGWSLGIWDSDRPGADAIADRVVAGTRAGSIILLHDGDGYDPRGDRTQTARALPQIISRLRDGGFTFVTLPAS